MDKKTQKQKAIIEKTSAYLLTHGLLSVSLRPLAKALNTSDRMLLHYFSSKEALLNESLIYIANQFVVEMNKQEVGKLHQAALIAQMGVIIQTDLFNQYMRLWLEILLSSLNSERTYGHLGGDFLDIYHAWIKSHLIIENDEQEQREISQTLAIIEGMVLFHIAKKDKYIQHIME